MPDNAGPARAQRRANRDFGRATAGACQQEVGDIHTCDQEHEQHGRDKEQEKRAGRSNNGRLERNQCDAESFVDHGILFGETLGDALHLSAGLFKTDTWLQASDHVHPHRLLAIAKPWRIPRANWQIHVAAVEVSSVVLKRGRDDAKDDV